MAERRKRADVTPSPLDLFLSRLFGQGVVAAELGSGIDGRPTLTVQRQVGASVDMTGVDDVLPGVVVVNKEV